MVKVKARLNLDGIFSLKSALLIEEEEVEVPVSQESSNMDIDKALADVAPPSINESDVNMQDAPVIENGAQETVDNPVQVAADSEHVFCVSFLWKKLLQC